MPSARTTLGRSLLATGAASLGLLAGVAGPSAPAGADPRCAGNDYLVARSAPLTSSTTSFVPGTVYLYYSSTTRCAFALVTQSISCDSAGAACADAQVVRSDGLTKPCHVNYGGSSCRTVAVYDGGYTAYAEAQLATGQHTYYGKTGSF